LRGGGDGEEVAARRAGVGEGVIRWARKNPLVASLTALLVAGTVVLSVVTWWAWGAAADALKQEANALAAASRADEAEQAARKLASEEKKERAKAKENEKKAKRNEKKSKD